MFQSINPYSLKIIHQRPFDSFHELTQKGITALSAFQNWKKITVHQRARLLMNVSTLLRKEKHTLAATITTEMGKPISQSMDEIEKCAWTIEWLCQHADSFLQPIPVNTIPNATVSVQFEPLGSILGIMPWNFPFWQAIRFIAPALLAGNVCLLKHAPNVPASTEALEHIFVQAGFPTGVVQNVFASVEDTGRLIESAYVQAVSFTGSERAGKSIGSIAGKSLKKCVLELGGSDAFIVLADADIQKTVEQAVKSRLNNNGQSCIAAKRFIIHESIYDSFLSALQAAVAALQPGDPLLNTTHVGPLARADLKKLLQDQVNTSVEMGAKIAYKHPFGDTHSTFFSPVILTDIPEKAPARTEELFGPVFSCFKIQNTDEAIRIANETNYGLGASVWCKQTEEGRKVMQAIEAGSVFMNGITRSDARTPFGGIKHSGYGRELSVFGMHEFVNIKTVWEDL